MKNNNDTKLIMVVEDEHPISDVMAEALTDEGYKVIQAFSVEEGLKQLETMTCDLISLDLNLADRLDGNDFLERLPQYNSDVPVIVVSATPNKLAKAHKQVKAVLPKPFDLNNFLDLVAREIG
ncbi:MAG TPA: response regulator [Chloroflexia bacterium]|nr:response regulator [Chloroflexia bacterium]